MTWRHLCACKDDPRKSQTPGQPLEKRDGKGKGLNLKSIVGGCHEQGGLASNSKVIQTIDDGKGSKERNLIRRSLTHVRISPNLPEYKVHHLIYIDSHSSRVVKNISQEYSNLRLQFDGFCLKTSSQSSVDAIDAELQTAELLKLLILLEE